MQLESDGPNGIKPQISSYYFHSPDSIFLFFNILQQLVLIDGQGNIQARHKLLTQPWSETNEIPTAQVYGGMVPFIRNNKMYLCSYGLAFSGGKAGLVYDLDGGGTFFPYLLPEIYSEGWWSGLIYDRFSQAVNDDHNLVVLSYGADKFLWVIDERGNIVPKCAKSRYLPDQLKPYSNERMNFDQHYLDLWRHEALQGGYSSVIYDKWRHVYYRIAFKPVPESAYTSPNQVWDNPVVVILDSDFRIVGESELPAGYLFTLYYVSPEGIFFYNRYAYENEDDDHFTFGRFTLDGDEKID
jgi:hypothetical protein